MRTWTILTAAIVTLVVSAAPGSFALWQETAAVADLTITTGRLNAAIASGTTTPTTQTTANLGSVTGILPTENRGLTFTVRNTGTVDLTVAAALSAATAADSDLAFGVNPGACTTPTPVGTALSTTPAAVGSAVAPATNATFCLRVTLTTTAPNSLQSSAVGPFVIALTAASTA
ncbi:hypothetical protein QL996_12605 [Planococcus sp. APC 4015]|nr:hypothetical protein [Planococcus sp. APC 4015]